MCLQCSCVMSYMSLCLLVVHHTFTEYLLNAQLNTLKLKTVVTRFNVYLPLDIFMVLLYSIYRGAEGVAKLKTMFLHCILLLAQSDRLEKGR